jgi:sugar lactone lactonase YvrE
MEIKVLPAIALLLALAPMRLAAQICAEVRLEIKQEATLEREAFDAKLALSNNYSDQSLENLKISVVFKDAYGNSADGKFFVKVSTLQSISGGVGGAGTIPANTQGVINWLIIPSTGAGGVLLTGEKYSVSAAINYTATGVAKIINTFSDTITIKPQPAIKLEYLLPFEVFGDEPLTPALEPIEPFALAVRVTNVGYGTAKDFKIDSGQPEIVDNDQGLAMDFKLLGTYVGNNAIPNSLLIPFGDIASGAVSNGSWIMSTTLSGKFKKFDAMFSHAAELGGQLTSLIQGVTTYTLVKDVLVDLPGRDGRYDFLVNTTTSRDQMEGLLNAGQDVTPDVIFESDQPVAIPVVNKTGVLSGTLSGTNSSLLVTVPDISSNLWVHVSMPLPGEWKIPLLSVRRSDGKELNSGNYWIARHFNKQTKTYSYRLHLLDLSSVVSEYTFTFDPSAIDQAPGRVTDLAASLAASTGSIKFNWSAPGEDGDAGDILGGRYIFQLATDPGAEFKPESAQINFATNTTPGNLGNYTATGLIGNVTYYARVWLQDTGGAISEMSNGATMYVLPNPPNDLALIHLSSSTVEVSWTIGNNNTPVSYEIRADTDTLLSSGIPSPPFDSFTTRYIFAGLLPNTTYLIRGRTFNPDTFVSSVYTNAIATVTAAEPPSSGDDRSVSSDTVTLGWQPGANPDWTEYLVQLSTMSGWSLIAMESGWVAQTDYVFSGLASDTTYYARAKARNSAGVETAFVDLGVLQTQPVDSLPPVTDIAFSAPSFGTAPVYVSSRTEISLTVYDDAAAAGDRRGNVAAEYYSVDSDTFSVYAGSFSVADGGAHVVRYYSADTSGNIEEVKVSNVTVDIAAPAAQVAIAGLVFSSGSVSYISAASTVTLTAFDNASGVKELYYAVNGSTYSAAAGSVTLALAEGVYDLAYNAVDNIGNISEIQISSVAVDNTAPVTTFAVEGSSRVIEGKLYVVAGSSLALSAFDALAGAGTIYYTLDGSSAAAASPLMLPAAAGEHALAFYCVDNVGNPELEKNVTFYVDAAAPVSTAAVAGTAGANGWYVSPVTLTLASTDTMSGVEAVAYSLERVVSGSERILLSSGAYAQPLAVNAEGVFNYSYHAVDLSGNIEPETTGYFKIDISTPEIVAVSSPAANAYAWHNTALTVVFSGTDGVSGIAYCTPDSQLELEGSSQTISGYCSDHAGLSSTASVTVNIDTTAPVSSAAVTGPYQDGYYTGPVTVAITAADGLSGVAGTEYSISGGVFTSYTTPFTVGTGNFHNIIFRSRDKAGNQESDNLISIEIRWDTGDVTPPVTTALINNVLASGASVYLTTSDTVSFAAADENPAVTYYSLDTTFSLASAAVYGVPFTLGAGTHTLSYLSVDSAGNTEAVKQLFLTVGLPVEHIADMGGYGTEPGRLSVPVDVAISPWNKSVYVTDSLNFRVQRFSIYGKFLSSIGSFGSGPGEFGGPLQAAAGPGGVDSTNSGGPLFVADPGNYRIQRFTNNGYMLSFGVRGAGAGQFEGLYSIAVDSVTSQVYAVDNILNRIQVFTSTGTYLRTLGAGALNHPGAIAVRGGTTWGNARVYVIDTGNSRIAVFLGSQYLTSWAGDFAKASGIHVDTSGRVYVSDERGWISVYTSGGGLVGRFGQSGSGGLEFNKPLGLTTDPAGYLYVADSLNDRVQKVRLLTADQTAPGAIGDPAAEAITPYYAWVGFTAPGDDGSSGRVAWYDARFSSEPITTPAEFENAQLVHTLETPQAGGSWQKLLVSGFEPGRGYYAAIRAYDESGNFSQSPALGVTTPARIPEGELIRYAGNPLGINLGASAPAVTGNITTPAALAVSTGGFLYIAGIPVTNESSFVLRVNPRDNQTTQAAGFAGSGYNGDNTLAWLALLNGPQGLALDGAGNILVADTGNNRIRKVDAQSNLITTLAGTGAAGYSGDGGPAAGAAISSPARLSLDGSGNIYFADTGNNVIRKIDAAGVMTTVAGTGAAGYNGDGIPAGLAQLDGPVDAEIDAYGNIYIAELNGNRIRKVDGETGLIVTLAGNGVAGYDGENVPAAISPVSGPADITVDPLGTVYFAERGTGRLRKLAVNGLLTTAAGGGAGTEETGPALAMKLSMPTAAAGDWARGVLYIADAARVTALGLVPFTGSLAGARPDGSSEVELIAAGAYTLTRISSEAVVSPGLEAVGSAYNISSVEAPGEGRVTFSISAGEPDGLAVYRFDGVKWASSTVVLQEAVQNGAYREFSGTGLLGSLFGVFRPATEIPAPAVAAIAPSSGAIGVPFTITGGDFGAYAAGTTVVLIGGASAPLTLWSTGTIKGTVPGSLAAGEQAVAVLRGTTTLANSAPFTVVAPAFGAVTPSSGAIGVPFTITGEHFGNYVAGYTRVLLGGATMPLTLWTDTQIKGTIPGTLPAGDYELLVERALNGGVVRTSTATFSLRNMEAYWLAPSSGPIGMPFTITGAGFGNYTLPYTSVLIGGTTAPLTLWTDTKIQGTVPGGLASGQHPVLVERRTSDGGLMQTSPMTFEVVNVDVASMTPVAGPIGLPFTIYGAGFGNYSAGYTKVLLGGTTCPLTLWTDTQIKGTIPGSLAAGEYPVVVERTLNGGQAQSVPLVFTVAAPEAYSLSPSSGPIGLPFVITGGNFGNYVANYTKVLIGGATAPLTLWTDTQIKGSIPGSLADGDHELVVERALNGGVVRTSTFTFTVGTPYLDTVSPSTASVVAPFIITGYNFGNYVANYTKVLINGTTTPLTLWTDTRIQGKLPYLPAGSYSVQVQRYLNGGLAESATAYIGVEEPVISSMTPASGAVGTVFNLYGTGFGPYEAAIAKVFIGGAQCALSLWTDTRITGTVPTALSYGTHTVVAARGQALANALEFYIPGGYTPSMMRLGTTPAALEFKLGEVYVYPDPAKGGKVPTFHIEVGTADSVKLKIYTVAGQLAHEATLTGNPQAVGSVYAYEYAWSGRIASGVYYYTIEAEKGGKKIKAKGKFAVVR